MRTGHPQSALQAVTWRRLPVSGWPWRSAGYLLTTVAVAFPAFAALAIPWLVLVTRLTGGDGYRGGMIVGLVLLGAALVGVLGPLISAPLAKLERRRLRMVDDRPIAPGHLSASGAGHLDASGAGHWRASGAGHGGAPGTGPRRSPSAGAVVWLRARYAEPATWRAVAYACLLATVAPVLSLAALLAVPLVASFLASPFLVLAQRPGDGPVALGFGNVATLGETLPYVIAGVVLLPLLPYLLTLLAGGHAAVARTLLAGPSERLRAELVEVSRSRARLADAFEAERRRIERDLHDGAQQRLVSLTLQLGLARLDLPPRSRAAESVGAAHEQAKQMMAELRKLIHGIQPQILADLGLPAAVGELADQSSIPVTVDTPLTGRLPGQVENTAYFVVAEALTNIAKHSGATGATVTARHRRGVLTVEIGDNGHGGADPDLGSGLTGLADRVAVVGGRMLLASPAGGPTLLRVEVPCAQSRPSSG